MPVTDFKVEFGAVPGLPGAALVTVSAPIDAKNVASFKAEMDALRERRIKHFLVEMGEVRYINSTGLAYLITAAESIRERGGTLGLINVQPKVKVILETMGLMGFVTLYAAREAAVKELQPAKPAPAPPAPAPSPSAIRKLFRKIFGPPSGRTLP